VLAALMETTPGWIVMVKRDVAEFGELAFGRAPQYGGLLDDYLHKAYLPVWQNAGEFPAERLLSHLSGVSAAPPCLLGAISP